MGARQLLATMDDGHVLVRAPVPVAMSSGRSVLLAFRGADVASAWRSPTAGLVVGSRCRRLDRRPPGPRHAAPFPAAAARPWLRHADVMRRAPPRPGLRRPLLDRAGRPAPTGGDRTARPASRAAIALPIPRGPVHLDPSGYVTLT